MQFLDLAKKYYDNVILWKIRNHIRRTLMNDKIIFLSSRGNYAFMCVKCLHDNRSLSHNTITTSKHRSI
ncbi:hypothetical protein SADUNF_Sadunf16G0179700 [Salix dunnii]|uniref:Uncharacterized protein n=1 Tax=Salix dunnii TaxID=1413687 RepID=A0A835MQK3_9ROSI|nr:hypothetical protein SADUNF_Sadunf16G0179700 [Salix dunnii]